jgi:hypothetical protein
VLKAFPGATEEKPETPTPAERKIALLKPSPDIMAVTWIFVETTLLDGMKSWKCSKVQLFVEGTDTAKWKAAFSEEFGRVKISRLVSNARMWFWELETGKVAYIAEVEGKSLVLTFADPVMCDRQERLRAEDRFQKEREEAQKKEREAREDNFRKTKWAMTSAQVRATEPEKPDNETQKGPKTFLFYHDTVSGLSCHVLYIFAYDKLVRAKYIVTDKHTNMTDYLSDYRTLSEALATKYGSPKENDVLWKNDLYKNDPQDWGMAVAVGHLSMYTKWETSTTIIFLSLSGENYKISLDVEYSSKEMDSLEDKADKEQERGKL